MIVSKKSLGLNLLLATLFFFGHISAQPSIPCGSDLLHQLPNYQQNQRFQQQLDQQIAKILKQGNHLRNSAMTTYTIPVVVHIIHQNGPENIPALEVTQGIQNMNDAFANTGFYDPQSGVPTDISFCLAVQDPQGNFTTGINRINSSLTNMTLETQDAALKGLILWDPTKYLNIWLVAEITSISAGPGVAGYATFPSSHGSPLDGIVEEARFFGATQNNSKVTVHEVGHYLGLYHTFEGGCVNFDCTLNGDHVCDTPPDGSVAGIPCGNTVNTCQTDEDDLSANNPFRPILNGGLGDQPDQHQNYMDYGYQACQNTFTQGQTSRMQAFLTGPRVSLLNSNGCVTPCTSPIAASFTPSTTTVIVGNSATFTNSTTGATTYNWTQNGTSFSSQTSPSLTFNTPGSYLIQLLATNGSPSCADSISVLIDVVCGLQANFIASSNEVFPGDTVTFTQTSPGALSYTWLQDGLPIGTGSSISRIFPTLGESTICLVTDNGICADTFCTYIPVGDCGRNRNNIWTFGSQYNGINFNSGVATWTQSSIRPTFESCASICDRNGNLMFSTNGTKLWRGTGFGANAISVPNGDSLLGGYAGSSTQGAIFIPKPLDDSTYYLFTADESVGWPYYAHGGLAYSEIDLRLPGLIPPYNGAVTNKNVRLRTPAAEKLAAVRHANGCDVWVVGHSFYSADFLAYRVSPNGVDTVPIVSTVGTTHIGGYHPSAPHVLNAQGQMKISPDGTKIALVLQDTSILEILDFDKATGIVSNPITYQHTPGISLYGLAFSPDGSKLYVGIQHGSITILQFDMDAGSPTAILNSGTPVISAPSQFRLGQLQRGPDGKIYGPVINQLNLLTIHNPNALGTACNVTVNGLAVNYPLALGLQNSISDYAIQVPPQAHGPLQVCEGVENVSYYFDQYSCSDSVIWTLPPNVSMTSQQNGIITVDFLQTGTYVLQVEAFTACGNQSDSLIVQVVPLLAPDLGPDTSLCGANNIQLSPGNAFSSYAWSTGATISAITVNQAGWYAVTTTSNGCEGIDSIYVAPTSPPPTANLGPDTTICNGAILALDPGGNYPNVVWQDNSSSPTYTAWRAGTYWVEVRDSCGQTARDTIVIGLDESFEVYLGNDTVICQGSQVLISPGPGFTSYEWQDGSTQPQFTVTMPGTYHVQVVNQFGCTATDTIFVDVCISLVGGQGAINPPKLFPVPSADFVNIGFAQALETNMNLELYDQLGRMVLSETHFLRNTDRYQIDLRTLAAGVYQLLIEVDGMQYQGRLIKQ